MEGSGITLAPGLFPVPFSISVIVNPPDTGLGWMLVNTFDLLCLFWLPHGSLFTMRGNIAQQPPAIRRPPGVFSQVASKYLIFNVFIVVGPEGFEPPTKGL